MPQTKMIRILIVIFLISLSNRSKGQRLELHLEQEKYYPSKNFDSISIHLNTTDIESYLKNLDTSNNLIYKKLSQDRNSRIYFVTKDSIKALKYSFKKREFVSLEVWVYNRNKQIVKYIDCTDYYFDKQKIYVQIEEFYYNDQNRLLDKLVYYNHHYHNPINLNSYFNMADFTLTNAIHYEYDKKLNSIFAHECMGKENSRSFDTLYLDHLGFVIKFNSFAKSRALGCPMGLHVNDIFEYKYFSDSVNIKYTQTTCLGTDKEGKCMSYDEPTVHMSTVKIDRLELNYYDNFNLRNKGIGYKRLYFIF